MLSAWSVPARRQTITITQSDGTKLTLTLVGDENMSYYINEETGEKMQQLDNGDFVRISDMEFASMVESAKKIKELRSVSRQNRAAKRKVGSFNEMKGKKNGIILLVEFPDKKFSTPSPQEYFDRMFNEVGFNENHCNGSVHDYFYDQSYGQLDIDFDVVGPIEMEHSYRYYGAPSGNQNDVYPATMVCEAIKGAIAMGTDFCKYKWTEDIWVDQVFVIYAGYGQNYTGADKYTIWPHEFTLDYAKNYYKDGDGSFYTDEEKTTAVNTYACSCELSGLSGTTPNGIGTPCHEFSHCLGYPDLYDTDYSGGVGMSAFDIMCNGSYNGPTQNGECPVGYSAYERWVAGWIEPEVLEHPNTITDLPSIAKEGKAYVIYNEEFPDEYYILENRQSEGWFRYFNNWTAAHGLLITHIDYNKLAWQNNAPNDNPNHQRVTWVPADGQQLKGNTTRYYADTGDLFPGDKKIKTFDGTTHQSAGGKWFNGTPLFNHSITEITEKNGMISFLYDGGYDPNLYTVTFDACGGTCDTESLAQQIDAYEELILPEATTDAEGWLFAGWSTEQQNDTDYVEDLLPAGSKFTPKGDTTIYAVYKRTNGGTWAETGYEDIETGTYVLMAETGECFNGDINQNGRGQHTTETVTSVGMQNFIPEDACILSVTKQPDSGYFRIYNASRGYLRSYSNGSFRLFAWEPDEEMLTKDDYWEISATNNIRYVGNNALMRTFNGEFRMYTSASYKGAKLMKASPYYLYNSNPYEYTDGIAAITLSDNRSKGIYDLQGRRISNPHSKGLYIINGKKVVK